MGIIAWLIVGALGGWIASFFIKIPGRGLLGNIIAGVVGGLIVGWLVGLLTGENIMSGISLTSIIAAIVGAIVVSAAYSWFMSRGAATANSMASGASNMASGAGSMMKDKATGAASGMRDTASGASNMASGAGNMMKDKATGAASGMRDAASGASNVAANAGGMTRDAAASTGSAMNTAAGAMAGMAGAAGLGQMSGMLNGILGGNTQLDANSELGKMVMPMADSVTAKLGLPREVGQTVVAFALAHVTNLAQQSAGSGSSGMGGTATNAMNPSAMLAQLTSGGGMDANTIQSTGLSKQLAGKTGMSETQATQGLEHVFGALSAGMSGQKSFQGTDLPDLSMLTNMMK